MKSLRYLFVFISVMLLVACGGNDNALQDETLQEVKLKGFEELNLKDWGFNLIVMVPKADINGEPKIEQTEGGSLEVVVGLDFGIEIMYGEADLALLKMDLEEDLQDVIYRKDRGGDSNKKVSSKLNIKKYKSIINN